MEKIDKAIEILNALKEGKTVEVYNPHQWYTINDIDDIFHFLRCGNEFRIKPEPKYRHRPYANAEEFLKDSREHGLYIQVAGCINNYHELFNVDNTGVIDTCGHRLSFEELVNNNAKWQDGSPCGVLEE